MRARGSARLCARSPQFQLFDAFCSACCCWCMYHVGIMPSVKLSSSLLCGGHGTTAVEHQAFLRSRTVYQFARARASYVCYDNEHIISREVQGCCKGSRAIQTHTYVLYRVFKSNRAATVATTAAVQQQYNSTSASNSALCDSHGAFVFYRCVQCSWDMFYTCNRS